MNRTLLGTITLFFLMLSLALPCYAADQEAAKPKDKPAAAAADKGGAGQQPAAKPAAKAIRTASVDAQKMKWIALPPSQLKEGEKLVIHVQGYNPMLYEIEVRVEAKAIVTGEGRPEWPLPTGASLPPAKTGSQAKATGTSLGGPEIIWNDPNTPVTATVAELIKEWQDQTKSPTRRMLQALTKEGATQEEALAGLSAVLGDLTKKAGVSDLPETVDEAYFDSLAERFVVYSLNPPKKVEGESTGGSTQKRGKPQDKDRKAGTQPAKRALEEAVAEVAAGMSGGTPEATSGEQLAKFYAEMALVKTVYLTAHAVKYDTSQEVVMPAGKDITVQLVRRPRATLYDPLKGKSLADISLADCKLAKEDATEALSIRAEGVVRKGWAPAVIFTSLADESYGVANITPDQSTATYAIVRKGATDAGTPYLGTLYHYPMFEKATGGRLMASMGFGLNGQRVTYFAGPSWRFGRPEDAGYVSVGVAAAYVKRLAGQDVGDEWDQGKTIPTKDVLRVRFPAFGLSYQF